MLFSSKFAFNLEAEIATSFLSITSIVRRRKKSLKNMRGQTYFDPILEEQGPFIRI